ncbi:MAG TPA: sigma-54 dependent transcriptional regulator [Anaeromyxobacteraceae bacterium]|nr:sigma-54 dependent transcriptional regulator [Anaeromyxobacteraceae bacterium]
MAARILVLYADRARRSALSAALREHGHDVSEASTAEEGLETLARSPFDGAICATRASGWSAPALVSRARAAGSDAAFVVTCSRDGLDLAIEALRSGAEGYVLEPEEGRQAAAALERALEKRRVRREADGLREDLRARLTFLGQVPEAQAVREVVHRAAPTKATVLVHGEPGTGKSLVAEMIHEASPRRDRPFVRASCAALGDRLLEAELFGWEAGALPDFPVRGEGAVERADGGTLHVREVASLPPALQVKLLRVLQHGEYERLEGSETLRADVRVVASTRLDLGEEVRAGRFRDDLYYRLNVVALSLPTLRARKGDLPVLAAHFLAVHGRAAGKSIPALTPGALSALFGYEWLGNVRELEDAMASAVANCRGDQAGTEDLPLFLHGARPDETAGSALIPGASLFEIEREAILRTLDSVGGSTARAAEILGVSVRKIQYRLKEYRTGAHPGGRELSSSGATGGPGEI